MKRIFFWATVLSGAAAAYLMYRRGEQPLQIARKAIGSPYQSLASEIKQAV